MRRWLGSIVVTLLLAATLGASPAEAVDGPVAVDLELVLAVDISYSMDPEEQALQRQGYVEAIQSREVLDAISKGLIGKIAITYIEWAGYHEQRQIVPWTVVDSAASAKAFTDAILANPIRRAYRTSLSGAIAFSTASLDNNGFNGTRQVIDISGDGPNNHGPAVTDVRAAALEKGIIINGLPILLKRPNTAWADIDDLDLYYQQCVIGGPGAFVIPIRTREEFIAATRRKLILEVSNIALPPIIRVQAPAPPQPVDCRVGERMWEQRWRN